MTTCDPGFGKSPREMQRNESRSLLRSLRRKGVTDGLTRTWANGNTYYLLAVADVFLEPRRKNRHPMQPRRRTRHNRSDCGSSQPHMRRAITWTVVRTKRTAHAGNPPTQRQQGRRS